MKNELLKYKVFRNINEVVAAVALALTSTTTGGCT